ncbi:MAG: multinuclear nonheme iron-dependent oxidase, partial [Thiobacillus sp.]
MNPLRLSGAGLGFRRELLPTLKTRVPDAIDFFELAPENWIDLGGAYGRDLRSFTERYPFVCHGLSLSLGGPSPLDEVLLRKTRQFMDAHGIQLYTEHLSYCSDDGH